MKKPSFKKSFVAHKEFTDRDDFKEVLMNALENPQKLDEYRVKVFYGAGGQGKSYLRDDFFVKNYLSPKSKENKSLIYVEPIDFENDTTVQRSDEALIKIAAHLIEKGSIPLPAFCIGFIKYKQKKSAEQDIQTAYPYLFKLITKYKITSSEDANHTVDWIAGEVFNELVNIGLELFSESLKSIPIINYFTDKAIKKGKNKLIEWIRSSEVKEILGNLDTFTETQLFERLPKLLAYDIYKYLENNINLDGNLQKRIVIIFDGYERLWPSEINRNIDKDKWIREFISDLPGVLFVIFGRDKINWSENDEEWNSILDQHLMQGLSDQDADKFLQKIPIAEKNIREAIIESSKSINVQEGCLPFLLDIQADTYANIINSNSSLNAERFMGNDKQVIEHFFEHIPKQTAYAIKVLSNLLHINESIINYLVRNQFISAGIISMKELKSFSFINVEAGQATIHGLMRDLASNQYQKEHLEEWLRLQEAMFNYFDKQLIFSEYTKVNSSIEFIFEYASFYKNKYDSVNMAEWVVDRTAFLWGSDKHNIITNILINTAKLQQIQDNKFLLGKLYFRLYNRYDDLKDIRSKEYFLNLSFKYFREILPIPLNSIDIENLLLDDEKIKILNWQFEVIQEKAKSLSDQDKLPESDEWWQIVINLSNKFGLNYNNIAFSELLSKMGRFAEVEHTFFYNYLNNDESIQKAYYANQLRRLMFKQGRYEEALKFHQIANSYYSTVTDEPSWKAFMDVIYASIYIKSGENLDLVENILASSFDIYRTNLSENHPWMSHYYIVLSELYIIHNQIEKAKEALASGLQINEKIYTSFNSETFEFQLLFVKLVEMYFINDKSLLFEDETYDKFKSFYIKKMGDMVSVGVNILGIYHPVLHEMLEWLINSYKFLEKQSHVKYYKDKQNEYRRILSNRITIRTKLFENIEISQEELSIFLTKCDTITSLPSNSSCIKITKFKLPFFKTFNLYCVSFTELHFPYFKYFLANENSVYLLDWTNTIIYKIAEEDLYLTEQNVIQWTVFFFDAVKGRHGGFYLLSDKDDIPFMLDTIIADSTKKKIADIVNPIKILVNEVENYILESQMVFKNSLFNSKINVDKDTGKIKLFDESILEVEIEGDNVTDLPISIDPVYVKMENWWEKSNLTLQELVSVICQYCLDLEDEANKMANSILWELNNNNAIPIKETIIVSKSVFEYLNSIKKDDLSFVKLHADKLADFCTKLINYLSAIDKKFTHLSVKDS
ncbi:tetratricopeptide repeat protein [Spirosoma panaciterrae]|uniref:tetratricopeptide repeat protein n=1 Tax=Spirosoma panaciterrae TaxID=496058 RepID=UPI000372E3E7|nr:tetratricopeptide repeat protein [Spirosoma panaciterrae]